MDNLATFTLLFTYLSIVVGDEIVSCPTNVVIEREENFRITCNYTKIYELEEIQWRKDGKLLISTSHGENLRAGYILHEDGSLEVITAEEEHEGIYRLIIIPKNATIFFLQPEIQLSLADDVFCLDYVIHVELQEEVNISCTHNSNASIVGYIWKKDGKPIDSLLEKESLLSSKGQLYIASVQKWQEGTYTLQIITNDSVIFEIPEVQVIIEVAAQPAFWWIILISVILFICLLTPVIVFASKKLCKKPTDGRDPEDEEDTGRELLERNEPNIDYILYLLQQILGHGLQLSDSSENVLAEKHVSLLTKIASDIRDTKNTENHAKAVGSGAGIVGGSMALTGLALAPFTFGGSLLLTATGAVVGGASAATNAGATIYSLSKKKDYLKDVEGLINNYKSLTTAFGEVASKCLALLIVKSNLKNEAVKSVINAETTETLTNKFLEVENQIRLMQERNEQNITESLHTLDKVMDIAIQTFKSLLDNVGENQTIKKLHFNDIGAEAQEIKHFARPGVSLVELIYTMLCKGKDAENLNTSDLGDITSYNIGSSLSLLGRLTAEIAIDLSDELAVGAAKVTAATATTLASVLGVVGIAFDTYGIASALQAINKGNPDKAADSLEMISKEIKDFMNFFYLS